MQPAERTVAVSSPSFDMASGRVGCWARCSSVGAGVGLAAGGAGWLWQRVRFLRYNQGRGERRLSHGASGRGRPVHPGPHPSSFSELYRRQVRTDDAHLRTASCCTPTLPLTHTSLISAIISQDERLPSLHRPAQRTGQADRRRHPRHRRAQDQLCLGVSPCHLCGLVQELTPAPKGTRRRTTPSCTAPTTCAEVTSSSSARATMKLQRQRYRHGQVCPHACVPLRRGCADRRPSRLVASWWGHHG